MGLSYSKWSKYKVMRKDAGLQKYLPETLMLNKDNLKKATRKFEECIVKPTGSFGGNGVTMIRRKDKGKFRLQAGKAVHEAGDFEALYKRVSGTTRHSYIIQKRIDLARVDGRLFDLRVMVQRHSRKESKWTVTGKLAKVGGKGYIITNTARSGGYVLPLGTALSRSKIPSSKHASIAGDLDRIALQTVRRLHASYGSIKTVGIDFGLDSAGRIWIIEANFSPSRALFKKLKDKTMYHRIIKY